MIDRLMARTRLDRLLPRGAILLAVLTFGGYAMGLVRDRIFARTFGAGTELDGAAPATGRTGPLLIARGT